MRARRATNEEAEDEDDEEVEDEASSGGRRKRRRKSGSGSSGGGSGKSGSGSSSGGGSGKSSGGGSGKCKDGSVDGGPAHGIVCCENLASTLMSSSDGKGAGKESLCEKSLGKAHRRRRGFGKAIEKNCPKKSCGGGGSGSLLEISEDKDEPDGIGQANKLLRAAEPTDPSGHKAEAALLDSLKKEDDNLLSMPHELTDKDKPVGIGQAKELMRARRATNEEAEDEDDEEVEDEASSGGRRKRRRKSGSGSSGGGSGKSGSGSSSGGGSGKSSGGGSGKCKDGSVDGGPAHGIVCCENLASTLMSSSDGKGAGKESLCEKSLGKAHRRRRGFGKAIEKNCPKKSCGGGGSGSLLEISEDKEKPEGIDQSKGLMRSNRRKFKTEAAVLSDGYGD